jgi:muramoyltetrapeptide carboxypeptidase LdcA involved in peptidoglycan recycling
VLASSGGDDQLTVLPHLDPELLAAHPKAFCGFSDNTNLLNYRWNLGIAGYHGGSTMVHLGGRAGGLHPLSAGSLRGAVLG